MSNTTSNNDPIMFLCIDLNRYNSNTRFVLLSIGTVFFFLANSYVEEYLFSLLPGFKYGWFMTLVELICFACIAMLERKLLPNDKDVNTNGIFSHNASLRQHFYVGAFMTLSRGLTNQSLQYLSYPTQVIFKSAKLLTVMIGAVFLMNKSYSKLEYGSAALLVASAALFSLGDAQLIETVASNVTDSSSSETATTVSFSTIGIIIVVLSLVFDSLHSNTQDKLVRTYHASTSEAMLYTNLFAAQLSFVVTLVSGELFVAYAYCVSHPISWLLLGIRALVIYFGVLCFLTLVKSSGAVLATAVTTVRKIATIACSYILFPKPMNMLHGYGVLAFLGSVFMSYYVVKQQQQKPKQSYTTVANNDTDKHTDDIEMGLNKHNNAVVAPRNGILSKSNSVNNVKAFNYNNDKV